MKHGFMAGVSALAMLAGGVGAAHATTFSYDGVVQTYTIPTTGLYDLTVEGAQGGASRYASGGTGAEVSGQVDLTKGTLLEIVVGEQGTGSSSPNNVLGGGGGGGSFVYVSGAKLPVAVAGGGGGGGGATGGIGLTTTSGGTGGGAKGGAGGSNGAGGSAGASYASPVLGGTLSGGGGGRWLEE